MVDKLNPDNEYSKFEFLDNDKKLWVRGALSDKMLQALLSDCYKHLVLRCDDWTNKCDFLLEKKEQINNLHLCSEKVDWNIINQFSELVVLDVEGWFNAKLNFSEFTKLKALTTYWNKGYKENIYNLPQLEYLRFHGWKEKNCRKLASYKKLKHLDLYYCKTLESLDGIEELKSLETLDIHGATKLTNIDALLKLPNLKSLSIESCKKVEFPLNLGKTIKLRFFATDGGGKIPSFKFLEDCETLEYIFTGATRSIDPEVGFLYKLPNLFMAAIPKARHYDVNTDLLEAELEAKFPDNFDEENKRRRKSITGNKDTFHSSDYESA